MSENQSGFVPDTGLDAHGVAAMTAEVAKEYLTHLIRYFPSWDLPSLTWLRQAAATRGGEDSQRTAPKRGSNSLTVGAPKCAAEVNEKRLSLDDLLPLLRKAPVSFGPTKNPRSSPTQRRRRKKPKRSQPRSL